MKLSTNNQSCNDSTSITREFRLASEYIRTGWYIVLGVIAVIALSAYLKIHGLVPQRNDGWIGFIAGAVLCTLAAGALLTGLYRWRLRIDERGIARRRISSWDLWTWEQFEFGQIHRHGSGFVCETRPWWRRHLAFDFLDERDRAFLLAACRHFYQLPTEQEFDSTIDWVTLRFQAFHTVTFNQRGILIKKPYRTLESSWSDVKEVRVLHVDQWSPEVRRIEVDLCNQTVPIHAVSTYETKAGKWGTRANSVSPEIAVVIRTLVPNEKYRCYALSGPPESKAEWSYRLGKVNKELRTVTWLYRLVPAGVFLFSAGVFLPKVIAVWRGVPQFMNIGWLVVATCCAVLTIVSQPLVVWAVLRMARKRLQGSLQELTELAEGFGHGCSGSAGN